MKKILIIANYFYPDVASVGQLMTDLCTELKKNFEVKVIAAIPNYSSKVIVKDEDKNKKYFNENIKGIDVYRIIVPNVDKRNKISRINYIFKYYLNSKSAIKNIKDYDIVFAISQPPLLGGLLGKYAKKLNNSKLVYNIQDFNPEQIEAVNYSKSRLLISILKKIDNLTLDYADKVILVGSDQLDTLKKRKNEYINKVVVINNWIDENEIYPLDKDNLSLVKFRKKYGLEDKFVIMYSGNLGLFYDLNNLIKVAKKLKHIKDIVFVFVGDGAKKKELENYKNVNNLENIVFIPYQPKEKLNISLNAADVHLVVNAKGIKGVSVPSKIYGVLAAGKYIIGVLEEGSEARTIIEKAKCGKCVEPQKYDEFLKLILEVYKRRTSINECGIKGRKYLNDNLTMNLSTIKYNRLFKELCEN